MSKKPEFRPTTEDLLGYLLGALDSCEQERVRIYVENRPEVQAELDRLRTCLTPLEAAHIPAEPPGGLARRTCECIFAREVDLVETRREAFGGDAALRDTWQLWDLSMMMAVVILLAMLATPAIYHARESSRRLACGSNLRELGFCLRSYSDLHGGLLPLVHTTGPGSVAGSYSMRLRDAGLLPNAYLLLCPSTESCAFRAPFHIPTLDQLYAMAGEELRCAQRKLGGSYGWHVGHRRNGVLVAAKDQGRNSFAITSDAPEHGRGHGYVVTHAGNGRNVLFESGRVSFIRANDEPVCGMDDLFFNRQCRLAPGADEDDTVIAESANAIGPFLLLATEAE